MLTLLADLDRSWFRGAPSCRLRALGRTMAFALLSVMVSLGWPMLGHAETILQFHHTAWTDSAGGPKVGYSLAQSDDGYLWIGSAGGLIRFDGTTFETIGALGGQPLRNEPVYRVVARPGGELWIGYEAGIGHYVNGRYQRIEPIRGVGARHLAVDPEGVVWAVSGGRLYRLEKGQMVQVDDGWAYPSRTRPKSWWTAKVRSGPWVSPRVSTTFHDASGRSGRSTTSRAI
jgi:ligand-binding sensor domain-containing protein